MVGAPRQIGHDPCILPVDPRGLHMGVLPLLREPRLLLPMQQQ
jgi:hypothetical protein